MIDLSACEVYHLPEHVSSRVDFVLPSVQFDTKHGRRDTNIGPPIKVGTPGSGFYGPTSTGFLDNIFTDLEHCDNVTTPACLRALYGLYYEPQATEKNSYGIGLYIYPF